MKKTKGILILGVIFMVLSANGQQIVQHNVTLSDSFDLERVQSNDSLSLTISFNRSASLYLKTVLDNETSEIFFTEQSFDKWLTQGAPDLLMRINKVASGFLKTNLFKNRFIKLNGLQEKKYYPMFYSAPMFALGSSEEQSGNYAVFLINALLETNSVEHDKIWQVTLPSHQLAAAVVGKDTLTIDPTPDQPIYISHNSSGHYYSPFDFKAMEPATLFAGGVYSYCDPKSLECHWLVNGPGSDGPNKPDTTQQVKIYDSAYVHMFSGDIVYSSQELFIADSDTGIIKLPAGSVITFGMRLGKVLTQPQAEIMRKYVQQNDPQNILSFLDSVFHQTTHETKAMLRSDNLVVQQTVNNFAASNNFCKYNKIEVDIKTGADTVFIGRDLKLPFWVYQVTASKPVQLKDTLFSAGTNTLPLWSEGQTNNSAAYTPSPGKIQKLQEGGFIPPHNKVKFILYYNEHIYRFIDGLKADILTGDANAITVKKYQTPH